MRFGVPWSLNSIAWGSLICWSRAPAISLRPCSTPETLRHLQTDTQGVYSNAVESVFAKETQCKISECKISDSYYLAKSNKCKTKKIIQNFYWCFEHFYYYANIYVQTSLTTLVAHLWTVFSCFNTVDLQILMGSMLYLQQGIENSPYSHLLAPIYWDEICDVFTRDACTLLGMSVESPLSVR